MVPTSLPRKGEKGTIPGFGTIRGSMELIEIGGFEVLCDNCGNDLTDQDRIELDGKNLCASAGRIQELDAAKTVYVFRPVEGTAILENYVCERSPR